MEYAIEILNSELASLENDIEFETGERKELALEKHSQISEALSMMSTTNYFEAFNISHARFTDSTFPDIKDFRGPLRHLLEEVQEAIDSGEEEEFADMFMLILSAFRLRFPGKNTHALLQMCFNKLAENRKRRWARNDKGYATHVE